MSWYLGIDIGSSTSKGVIVNDSQVVASEIMASGFNYGAISQKLRKALLIRTGLVERDIVHTGTTGHGENVISFSHQHLPDLRCCAKGIQAVFPLAQMVVDIQSESSQVIQIDKKGNIINYAVSEVCAGSSGSFIETIANVLQLKLEDIGPLSLNSNNPVAFATGCAVFGESEAISRVSEGVPKEDILAGVHTSLAARVSQLIEKIGLKEPCAFSGGCAMNVGLQSSLKLLGLNLLLPPQPQIINALGAALIARDEVEK